MSDAPLRGVRVLELARVLAGPWAGQLLADLGADVIKVERPGAGDDTRSWGPPFVTDADGADLGAAYFHSCNRGKRSIAVDLASEAGRAEVKALAAEADVVVENFKIGALARHGLDAATLRAAHPRLIYCSITGFGQTGPCAHRAGYDYIVQGMGGLMSLTGEPGGPPQKSGVAVADLFTGLYATVAILAALERRHATGVGATIDMALLDTQVGVLANQALNWMTSGEPPRRIGNGHLNLAPYQSFAARDGDVIVAVGNDRQFARLCAVLAAPALAADPRFSTNADRVRARDALTPLLAAAIAPRSVDELSAALEAAGVPAGVVNDVDRAFADPQVIHRGMRTTAQGRGGPLPALACPIVIDGERPSAGTASPRLDEHAGAWWRPRDAPIG